MRAFQMVLQKMGRYLPSTSKRLRDSLLQTLQAAVRARNLSMTEVAHQLPGTGGLKHKVKTLWRRFRQLGQPGVLQPLWRALAHALLEGVTHPVLLVDWSALNQQESLLCCMVAHEGRALPLYFAHYPTEDFGKPAVEHAFLRKLLREIVPQDCHPLLAADAGFRSPWFNEVTRLGGHYIGRLGPKVQLQPQASHSELWVEAPALGLAGGASPEELGLYWVCKGKPVLRRVVRCRRPSQRLPSQQRRPSKGRNTKQNKHRNMAKMGYVLVTSLTREQADAAQVVALYDRRMQLEELLRTLKSERYGLGASASQSHRRDRLAVVFWLAALLCVVLQCVGVVAYQQGWHKRYQTNTTKDRRVLAAITLGRRILLHHDQRALSHNRLEQAFSLIPQMAERCPHAA